MRVLVLLYRDGASVVEKSGCSSLSTRVRLPVRVHCACVRARVSVYVEAPGLACVCWCCCIGMALRLSRRAAAAHSAHVRARSQFSLRLDGLLFVPVLSQQARKTTHHASANLEIWFSHSAEALTHVAKLFFTLVDNGF